MTCRCWMCRVGRFGGLLALTAMAFGLGHSGANGHWQWVAFFGLSTAIWFVAALTREG